MTADERAENVELRAENAQLRMERDLLKRSLAFWVKESTLSRYACVADQKAAGFPVNKACEIAEVSTSEFSDWCQREVAPPTERELAAAELIQLVREISPTDCRRPPRSFRPASPRSFRPSPTATLVPFGQYWRSSPVGVLVRAALPWTARVCEEDWDAGLGGELHVSRRPFASIPRQRADTPFDVRARDSVAVPRGRVS